MKKTGILGLCVILLLLMCMIDSYMQKKEKKPYLVKENGYEVQDTVNVKEEEKIRVLIREDNYKSEYHDSITVASAAGFYMKYGNMMKEFKAEEQIEITAENQEFGEGDILYLNSKDGAFMLPLLQRSQTRPVYEGTLEIRRTENGLLLINELPLETYLCGVVPSEMPASYPMEALKAQAVCARTYAKKQKKEERAAEFHADVDDSVSYQVYNNQPGNERTDKAVKETEGIVLKKDGVLLDAWYYSTSCGMNFSIDLSEETVFAAFLTENQMKAYEAEEPWYRWNTEILLTGLGDVQEIEIQKRAETGRVEELLIVRQMADGQKKQEIVEGEYAVRKFMSAGNPVIYLQDGSTVQDMELLPSAFFIMEPVYDGGQLTGYQLHGGGYGHGNGMSQNGAKAMAQEGIKYIEILENYYGKGTCLAENREA